MHAIERRLDVERARLFDELGEAIERLELGRHRVQERRSEYVHSLDVCKTKLVVLLSVYTGNMRENRECRGKVGIP